MVETFVCTPDVTGSTPGPNKFNFYKRNVWIFSWILVHLVHRSHAQVQLYAVSLSHFCLMDLTWTQPFYPMGSSSRIEISRIEIKECWLIKEWSTRVCMLWWQRFTWKPVDVYTTRFTVWSKRVMPAMHFHFHSILPLFRLRTMSSIFILV